MDYVLLISVLLSFTLALLVIPRWIRKCRGVGLLWEDMNKFGHPKNVASSGGVVVVMSFIFGVLAYIALKTFVFGGTINALDIFALLSVILILAIVGLTDDLLGWKHGGLSIRLRVGLALLASIPLVVINAGHHVVNFPFLGPVNFGLLYPLLIIPLAIAGAATTYNFLAGFNGLETGQGVIILSFLSFVAYATGSAWLSIIGLCMVAALVAFYFYNKFPAKVFPGDSLTYAIGALIASMAILGNFEKIALFIFIPYFLEIGLKLRGGLKKHSFGVPDKKGGLNMPYDKIYGLEHLAIFILSKLKKKVTERDVVYLIFSFQILIVLIAFLMWFV
jgi:UDP-N-acetylglucosamine--dolichyl-phosphate N-acetylglucosaminephosphotransferase